MTHIATIPFSGLYETLHSMEIDNAFDRMFDDSRGDVNYELQNRAWIFADFSEAREDYAKAYAESFCHEFKINGQYESMKSPKEYNFTTDQIYIEITEEEVKRLYAVVDKKILDSVCRENLTSRDGFISFYDPDFTQWGDVTEWDHNQLGQLIEAIVKQENPDFDMGSEYALMEDHLCSGAIEENIYKADKRVQRFVKIADYLRQREER